MSIRDLSAATRHFASTCAKPTSSAADVFLTRSSSWFLSSPCIYARSVYTLVEFPGQSACSENPIWIYMQRMQLMQPQEQFITLILLLSSVSCHLLTLALTYWHCDKRNAASSSARAAFLPWMLALILSKLAKFWFLSAAVWEKWKQQCREVLWAWNWIVLTWTVRIRGHISDLLWILSDRRRAFDIIIFSLCVWLNAELSENSSDLWSFAKYI